jgi:hypothetical protein
MRYFIQGKEVNKEKFDIEFDKELEKYEPISEYWPAKEDVRDKLKEQRYFEFPKGWKYFLAVEDEIYEMMGIIAEAEFDSEDNDAIVIALALYNKGYKKC